MDNIAKAMFLYAGGQIFLEKCEGNPIQKIN